MRDFGPHVLVNPRLRAGNPAWADPTNKAGLVANEEFFGVGPVIAITLLPTSNVMYVNDFVDLTATITQSGAPVVGACVSVQSSNTAAAVAIAGNVRTLLLDSTWAATITSPGGTSPLGVAIQRITDDGTSGRHDAYTINLNSASGSNVYIAAEVKLTNSTRDIIRVGFDDGISVGAFIEYKPSTGAITWNLNNGTAYGGVKNLSNGWYWLWIQWKGTHDGSIGGTVAGSNTSSTASNGTYYDVGKVTVVDSVNTDVNGNVKVRVSGNAIGTANITASYSGATSNVSVIQISPVAIIPYEARLYWLNIQYQAAPVSNVLGGYSYGYIVF